MNDIQEEMAAALSAADLGRVAEPTAAEMAGRFSPGLQAIHEEAMTSFSPRITPEELDAAMNRYKAAPVGPVVGIKHDAGKAPVWQGVFANFPNALLQVAHVSRYGQTKHPSYQNWQQVPDALNRYRDGLGRHMLEIAAGEQFDAESKLLHAAHFAWNALAVLELQLREAARVE